MDHNLPFDIDALLVFGKVVECRSLSKAAALLHMPKSTVSRKLAKLEADLGVKLLRKNTHQLTITDLGDKIYTHALKLQAEANTVRALVEGSKSEPQGVLRVAMPLFMGIEYASRVGATFLQRYPKSELEIRLIDGTAHPVKEGFDVVFGIGPLQDSTLIARKLFTLESFLCASSDFVSALPQALTSPKQLNDLPFIDAGFYSEPRKLLLMNGRKRYELTPTVKARANNFQVSKEFLLQGLGFGAMPQLILCNDELRAGTLVPLLPDWSVEGVDVYMLYPFQLSFSSLITAFYQTALEVIEENIERGRNSPATRRNDTAQRQQVRRRRSTSAGRRTRAGRR